MNNYFIRILNDNYYLIAGKSARGKWKNLKDHFRKEYKRCMRTDCDQEMSKWPYFHYMMFIKDQISHTVSNSLYLSDFQSQNIYSEVKTEEVSDEDNPLNCVNAEYDNQSLCEVKLDYSNENENISDDKHFLLSLLPMFSALSPDKKLKARIAIETSLLNITYPNLSTPENSQVQQKSPNKSEKRKRTSEDEHHQKNNPSKVKKCLL